MLKPVQLEPLLPYPAVAVVEMKDTHTEVVEAVAVEDGTQLQLTQVLPKNCSKYLRGMVLCVCVLTDLTNRRINRLPGSKV